MALDISKIKARLESMKANSNKSTSIWKPTPGKTTVRFLPYTHSPEFPFVELLFHYNLNGKTYLSPTSFGRPDPIVEFATKLKKNSSSKEEWTKAKALDPKPRTYAPILVRGQENEGVKFWGMGKTVYQSVLDIMNDTDFGDITDLNTGRDILVEFKTAAETGKSFPETTVRPRGNTTPAFASTDKVLFEKVKHQRNIVELFPELSYDELTAVMDTWVNSVEGNPDGEEAPIPTIVDDSEAPVVVSSTTKASVKSPISPTAAKQEFDDMFNA